MLGCSVAALASTVWGVRTDARTDGPVSVAENRRAKCKKQSRSWWCEFLNSALTWDAADLTRLWGTRRALTTLNIISKPTE
jgi:hypothetical protein